MSSTLSFGSASAFSSSLGSDSDLDCARELSRAELAVFVGDIDKPPC